MLSNLNDVLPALEKRSICLPAFDIGGGQPDFLLGVLRACEEAGCPALMLVWGGASYLGLAGCVDLVSHFAERSEVPVVLHLDHGNREYVPRALELGFKSVMFDASSEPLEENARQTAEMCALAHRHGATIEGELGHIGRERGDGQAEGELTDPEEAAWFVRETGIDLLAPAVGNAHGFYSKPPRLRFDLIEELARRTGVPLSLHGGTGIPLEDVRRAGELGMRKMNVASRLHRDFSHALRDYSPEDGNYSWGAALRAGRQAVGSRVGTYLRELNAEDALQ